MNLWHLVWVLVSGVLVGISHLVLRKKRLSGKKRLDMHKSTCVIVKFSSRPHIEQQIGEKWSINDLKRDLGKKLNMPVDNIKLIFAGKELDNTALIEEYDLGHQSIIHAVPSVKSSADVSETSSPPESMFTVRRNVSRRTSTLNGDEDVEVRKKKMGFYVYCNVCKGLQRGKLRVRCNICKQGTLIVNRDPCGWDDVLIPGQMSGVCQSENCEGAIAEFYFKCASHPSSEGDYCVALNQIRFNDLEISCLSCMDVNDIVCVFTCVDSHLLCLECFILYCTTRLNERQFVQDVVLGYTLPCPASCENSLIKETHHFKLVGDELYARYQRFGAEECLLQAGGVLCPVPGCGAGILPDPDCNRVTCVKHGDQGCGFVFCRRCLQGFHLGACETLDASASSSFPLVFTINTSHIESARWDRENASVIQVTTKPCPKCRTPTERDGGCMHMICTRPNCGFHWCWVCQCEWTRECMGNHWFG